MVGQSLTHDLYGGMVVELGLWVLGEVVIADIYIKSL